MHRQISKCQKGPLEECSASSLANKAILDAAARSGSCSTGSSASSGSARAAGTFRPHKPSQFDLRFCGLEDQTARKNKLSVFRATLWKANISEPCGIWKCSTFLLYTKAKKLGGKIKRVEGEKRSLFKWSIRPNHKSLKVQCKISDGPLLRQTLIHCLSSAGI